MYVRRKGYNHYLVRNVRRDGEPRQEVIAYLGEWQSLDEAIVGLRARVKENRAEATKYRKGEYDGEVAEHRDRAAEADRRRAHLIAVRQWINRSAQGPRPGPRPPITRHYKDEQVLAAIAEHPGIRGPTALERTRAVPWASGTDRAMIRLRRRGLIERGEYGWKVTAKGRRLLRSAQ